MKLEAAKTEILEKATGSTVARLTALSGGDVAQSFRAEGTNGRTVFVKTHQNPPPGFFTTEASGLEWLRTANQIPVPAVLAVSDDPALLVLEWIEEAGGPPTDEELFGRSLANLHQAGAVSFGRQDRRTTGSRALPNQPCETWVEFYADNRLRPLAKLAADQGALPATAISELETVADNLAELGGPPEPPARLHGDLWAGNRLVDRAGRSWLIDPACHGGHREFDLAMMHLFGGFSAQCHSAYNEVHQLADGWPERVALHQLAPLVVHAIKFGGGYRAAATDAIARYR